MEAETRVIGYRVTTDVKLELKDFSKIGPITQQLAEANVSETQTLNYILENMDDAKNHAVEDAYRRARNSAETVARASGRTLGELSYASVDTFENPRVAMPRMARAMAAARNAANSARQKLHAPDWDRHGARECTIQFEVEEGSLQRAQWITEKFLCIPQCHLW
jgi:uncharacterized protein YggE